MKPECYPTFRGVALSPEEIWLPDSKLDLDNPENFSNHHGEYVAKWFGGNVLYLTFRNLDRHQTVLPNDVHSFIHREFVEPQYPTPYQVYNDVMEAHENCENLRYGSANHPKYKDLTAELMAEIELIYKQIK